MIAVQKTFGKLSQVVDKIRKIKIYFERILKNVYLYNFNETRHKNESTSVTEA